MDILTIGELNKFIMDKYMPLLRGKKNIGKNISMEMKKHPKMKRKQAIAIALSVSRKKK